MSTTNGNRKRTTPNAPQYSPNQTLNQMTEEAEARQQDTYTVQKEARAIRAKEMEKQRKEDNLNETCNKNTHATQISINYDTHSKVKPLACLQPTALSSSNIKIETELDEEIDYYDDDDDNLFRPTRLPLDQHHQLPTNEATSKPDNTTTSSNKIQMSLSSSSSLSMNEEEREKDEYNGKGNINSQRNSTTIAYTSPVNGSINTSTQATPITIQTKPIRLLSTSNQSFKSSTNDLNADNDENPKELKKKLGEMEEKHKKHAMYQTQLENDNQKLIYEVDNLKDLCEEYEELLIELKRQFKDKSRDCEHQKREYKDLFADFNRLKDIIKQRDKLIEDSGLILYTDDNMESSAQSQQIKSVLPAALVSNDTAKLLDQLGDGTIDDKLKRILVEKNDLKEKYNKLKADLDDELDKNVHLEKKLNKINSKLNDSQDSSQTLQDMQRQFTKEINDLKLKLQKVEHENALLKQEKTRVDAQLKTLQTEVYELEQKEDRLDKEKRELKKELNESRNQINSLQTKLDVLTKTLEKKREIANRHLRFDSSSIAPNNPQQIQLSSSYTNSYTLMNVNNNNNLLSTPNTSTSNLIHINATNGLTIQTSSTTNSSTPSPIPSSTSSTSNDLAANELPTLINQVDNSDDNDSTANKNNQSTESNEVSTSSDC